MNNSAVFSFRGPFGVPVEIHSSFLMLAAVILFLGGTSNIVWALSFFAILAISIFLHEIGHAWGYLVQGLPVRRVVMHGGGGFCEGTRSHTPRETEFIVAMGPIVNLILWATSGLFGTYLASIEAFSLLPYVDMFSRVNFFLAVFNLLPVQPLDGGKLLHLFALRIFSAPTAAKLAGGIGLIFSILWIPAALFFFITFGFILLFFPSIQLHYQLFKNGG